MEKSIIVFRFEAGCVCDTQCFGSQYNCIIICTIFYWFLTCFISLYAVNASEYYSGLPTFNEVNVLAASCNSSCFRDGASEPNLPYIRRSRFSTRVLPQMHFACNGTIVRWRAAAERRRPTRPYTGLIPVLQIWRERTNEPGTYTRASAIRLGICPPGQLVPRVTRNVYECILRKPVPVQQGDLVGLLLPHSQYQKTFRLYFSNAASNLPLNNVYNFFMDLHAVYPPVNLTRTQVMITEEVLPLIALEVVPGTLCIYNYCTSCINGHVRTAHP